MRAFFFFLCAFLTFFDWPCPAQTVRWVSNNGATGVNVYRSAQEAHDAADPFDILLIGPNLASDSWFDDYGSLTLTKPLTIYGNGYFLNLNTELSADDRTSHLNSVTFDTGSQGSEIYGIESDYVNIGGVSNIKIARCHIRDLGLVISTTNLENTASFDVSNIIIHSSFLAAIYTDGSDANYAIDKVLIVNNIITHLSDAENSQNWDVRNNTFTGTLYLYNANFENNLCYDLSDVQFSNVTCVSNVSSGNELPEGNGNQNDYQLSEDEFIGGTGLPEEGGTSPDNDENYYRIKEGSPLKTAASDGGEVGAFGGDDPYVISGIPPIPSLLEISVETEDEESMLRVTIDLKSNH